jgi:hypothetical protein
MLDRFKDLVLNYELVNAKNRGLQILRTVEENN